MRSLKSPTRAVVSSPFFHFSLYARHSPFKIRHYWSTTTKRALARVREKEGPFPYQRRGRCKRRRTETLSSRSFRVLVLGFERKRERIQMAGDAPQTNPPNDGAAPLPIVTTTTTTETDGGVDRSVHPSGIVPTLQCVFFVLLFFCYVYSLSEMRR